MNRKITTAHYTVGRHTFALQMDSNSPLWNSLGNYIPFMTTERNDERSDIFTLSLKENVTKENAIPEIVHPQRQREEAGRIDAYRTPSGHLFEIFLPFCEQRNCLLSTNAAFNRAEAMLTGSERQQWYGLNSALMLLFALSTADKSTVLMHASAVMCGGKAYLFLGKSGTGKSTHSRLWKQTIEEVELLNDDHPIVRVDDDGQATVYGSPWSGKTPCYRNLSTPVGAVVRIRQSKENNIWRLSPVEAYASLMSSCSGMTWREELAEGRNRTMQQIIKSIACYTLECLPDDAAARLCADIVREERPQKEAPCNG